MKSSSFVKKQIALLVLCIVLATVLLVVGILEFNQNWLKIVLCIVIAILLSIAMYAKIFIKTIANKK